MRNIRACNWVVTLALMAIPAAEASVPPPAPPVALEAVERLAAYRAGTTAPSTQKMAFVYFTPADRDPPPGYRQRLGREMVDIQRFYADGMQRNGLGRRTIQFDLAADGALNVIDVKGQRPADDYLFHDGDESSLGAIRRESKPALSAAGIDDAKCIVIYFCNLRTIVGSKVTGVGPFNGSGSFVGRYAPGRCWFIDSAITDPKLLGDRTTMVDDQQYGHISLGKYNSIFIGGAAHEIGHALGLPHDAEQPGQLPTLGHSLMGSGNRTYRQEDRGEGPGSFLTLPDALRLASHPMFSGSERGVGETVTGRLTDVRAALVGDGVEFCGRVESSVRPYAVVLYSDHYAKAKGGRPPAISDYDSPTWTAPLGADDRFAIHVAGLRPGRAQFRLLACYVNAASSEFKFPFTVDDAGKPDVAALSRQPGPSAN